MAAHFSVLAWRTPWAEEPDGLQSTGSQRVRHGWALMHQACWTCRAATTALQRGRAAYGAERLLSKTALKTFHNSIGDACNPSISYCFKMNFPVTLCSSAVVDK